MSCVPTSTGGRVTVVPVWMGEQLSAPPILLPVTYVPFSGYRVRFVTPGVPFPALACVLSDSSVALVSEAESQDILPMSKWHVVFWEGNYGVVKQQVGYLLSDVLCHATLK